MSQQLIKQLREQRMAWVDLEPATASTPAKRVRIIRPTEVEVGRRYFKDRQVSVGFEEVCDFVVDWSGLTEADLLGASVGSSDSVPFSQALWGEVAGDKSKWNTKVANALLDAVVTHMQTRADTLKN